MVVGQARGGNLRAACADLGPRKPQTGQTPSLGTFSARYFITITFVSCYAPFCTCYIGHYLDFSLVLFLGDGYTWR